MASASTEVTLLLLLPLLLYHRFVKFINSIHIAICRGSFLYVCSLVIRIVCECVQSAYETFFPPFEFISLSDSSLCKCISLYIE